MCRSRFLSLFFSHLSYWPTCLLFPGFFSCGGAFLVEFFFFFVGWVVDFFLVVKYKIKHKKYGSNYELYKKLTPKKFTKQTRLVKTTSHLSYEELQSPQICVLKWSMEEIRPELRFIEEFLHYTGFVIRHLQSLSSTP